MDNITEDTSTANQVAEIDKAEEPKGGQISELARSKEIKIFYQTLAAVQRNAILRVLSGRNEAEMKERAVRETVRLRNFGGGGKCPPGTTRNPITGECE